MRAKESCMHHSRHSKHTYRVLLLASLEFAHSKLDLQNLVAPARNHTGAFKGPLALRRGPGQPPPPPKHDPPHACSWKGRSVWDSSACHGRKGAHIEVFRAVPSHKARCKLSASSAQHPIVLWSAFREIAAGLRARPRQSVFGSTCIQTPKNLFVGGQGVLAV